MSQPETVHTTENRYTVDKYVTRDDGIFYAVAEDGIPVEEYRERWRAVARANTVANQSATIARLNRA